MIDPVQDELIDDDLTTGAGFRAHFCFLSPRSSSCA
jgi:hypothetical protein